MSESRSPRNRGRKKSGSGGSTDELAAQRFATISGRGQYASTASVLRAGGGAGGGDEPDETQKQHKKGLMRSISAIFRSQKSSVDPSSSTSSTSSSSLSQVTASASMTNLVAAAGGPGAPQAVEEEERPPSPRRTRNVVIHNALENEVSLNKLSKAIKKVGDANTVNDDKQTPLHIACAKSMLDHVILLLKKGADINARDMNGWTALHYFTRETNLDGCRLLLAHKGIDVRLKTKEKTSVLHYLVRKNVKPEQVAGFLDVMGLLIEKGIDINVQNRIGETPLHSACMAPNVEAIKYLLAKGANPNIQNQSGDTALHYAVRAMNPSMVELLMHNGADLSVVTNEDQTAVDLAELYQQSEILEMIDTYVEKMMNEIAQRRAKESPRFEVKRPKPSGKRGSLFVLNNNVWCPYMARLRQDTLHIAPLSPLISENGGAPSIASSSPRPTRSPRSPSSRRDSETAGAGGSWGDSSAMSYSVSNCQVREIAPGGDARLFCFSVMVDESPPVVLTLATDSMEERKQWIQKLQQRMRSPCAPPRRNSGKSDAESKDSELHDRLTVLYDRLRHLQTPLNLKRNEARIASIERTTTGARLLMSLLFAVTSPRDMNTEFATAASLSGSGSETLLTPTDEAAAAADAAAKDAQAAESAAAAAVADEAIAAAEEAAEEAVAEAAAAAAANGGTQSAGASGGEPDGAGVSGGERDGAGSVSEGTADEAGTGASDAAPADGSGVEGESGAEADEDTQREASSEAAAAGADAEEVAEAEEGSDAAAGAAETGTDIAADEAGAGDAAGETEAAAEGGADASTDDLPPPAPLPDPTPTVDLAAEAAAAAAPADAEAPADADAAEDAVVPNVAESLKPSEQAPSEQPSSVEPTIPAGTAEEPPRRNTGGAAAARRSASPLRGATPARRSASARTTQTPVSFAPDPTTDDLMHVDQVCRAGEDKPRKQPRKKSPRSANLARIPSLCKQLSSKRASSGDQQQALLELLESHTEPVTDALCEVMSADDDHFLESLMVVCSTKEGLMLDVMKAAIGHEIFQRTSHSTLFREMSMATKLFAFYTRQHVGQDYLKMTIKTLVDAVLAYPGSLDVNPKFADKGLDIDANFDKIMELSQAFLASLTNTANLCPLEMREAVWYAKKLVADLYPQMRQAVVGCFIFLRFFCPALVRPHDHGLLEPDVDLPPHKFRTLVLLSKLFQSLASGVEFDTSKEEHLLRLNPFIQKNKLTVSIYLDNLTSEEAVAEAKKSSSSISTIKVFDRDSEKVKQCLLHITKELQAQRPRIEQLLDF